MTRTYEDIASELMQYLSRVDLLKAYALPDDATDAQIGEQAVLWGDANTDGSLN